MNRTGGMQGLFPRSDPCETGHGSRTGCSTCWLLSAPVGTLCRLLWRECTPFSRKPGEPLANLPAWVTRETRVIGTMPEAAAVTPVTIIRVSCHNVLATQRLQQRFRVCRVMPISQASCRNLFCHIGLRRPAQFRLFKRQPISPSKVWRCSKAPFLTAGGLVVCASRLLPRERRFGDSG